ncbi:MAG: helix-turn-helix transcriptional regulator [Aquificae bacterium]|nr:helix-turn-helix transcriptional regulator [Aquificota bacterium]
MKLANFRKKHRIRQEDLAKNLGITQASLSQIERGIIYPSLSLALKIEEYTRQIDPDNYIKATELINPKKLEEFKLLQKVAK